MNTVTLGAETEEETGDSTYDSSMGSERFPEKTARTRSLYGQELFSLDQALSAALGIRLDDHDEFGSETTYRAAPSYRFKETGTRIKGTYGTGFKAPSLFQLYSSYGSPDLQPEESTGWDAGIEQEIGGDRCLVDVTWFENDIKHMIDFDFTTWKYSNVAKAETRGLEVSSTLKITDELSVKPGYVYTHTEDKTTGDELLRRPADRASLDVFYRWRKLSLDGTILYVGESEDMDFATMSRVELDSYTLLNLSATYALTDRIQVHGRIENLLDEDYEEVYGYGTAGQSVYGGVKVVF
jgi:vitamin B12 transporter